MKTFATVHVIAQNKEGKFIILQRAENRSDPGTWNCITGYMEERESAEDAALRELKEETNLDGIILKTGDPHWSDHKDARFIIVASLVDVENVDQLKVDTRESQDHAWVTIDDERVRSKESLIISLKSIGLGE